MGPNSLELAPGSATGILQNSAWLRHTPFARPSTPPNGLFVGLDDLFQVVWPISERKMTGYLAL